jgi:hypothetical protein
LEFRTATFKKDDNQTLAEGNGVIYFLLGAIFFLLNYLLFEFGVNGWPNGIVLLAAMIFFYLMRYHDWGKKDVIPGHLDKELIITANQIQIGQLIIETIDIDKLKFYLDKYDNQITYSSHSKVKSDGNSNRIEIRTNGKSYSEFFRVGTKIHLSLLNKVIKEIKQKGIAVEVIKVSI